VVKGFYHDRGLCAFSIHELFRLARAGREVWLQASYNPILDIAGKPYKVVKYAADVTAQVQMQNALDGAVQEAQLNTAS
jgi:methyl-accepting chemotaxis protein